MEGRQLRDREAIALDLVGVVGLSAFFLGLTWLQANAELGFDPGGALSGVLGQLSVTLPAAILVLGATALELGAGLVIARAARRRPFDSVAEALLAAMVGAVLKGALLVGTLAAFGLFLAPILIGIDVAIVAVALFLPPVSSRVLPLTAFGSWRARATSAGSITVAALVGIVWAGPVILQLASPVVPFIDVLPNYVGPVEHLRTFGWFEPLTATQSPIIGPSRSVLGYDGLLGSLATMTGLPGGLAIAGFILPQTVLIAAGAHRLASSFRNGDPPVGAWALLAFALSQPFARLADARGTVVVWPLICLGLAIAAEALAARRGGRDQTDREPSAAMEGSSAPPAEDPWRIGRGVVIGLALGSATLVHPVIGFFAIVTVGIVGLLRPTALAPTAFVATLTSGLIALPQLATMIGIALPTIALGIVLPTAIAVSIAAGLLVERREAVRAGIVRLAQVGRVALAVAAVGGVVLGFVISILDVDRIPGALGVGTTLVLESSGLLLIVLVVGAAMGSRGARSPLVWAGLAAGVVAALLTQVLPNDLGFLGSALQYEVPKTLHYWLSAIAAAGAANALAYAWSSRNERIPWIARVAAIVAFVVVAALPLRAERVTSEGKVTSSIDAAHLGEHRWSETFAIDLQFADTGYWRGFPDSRFVVDEPRQELIDVVRAEIDAGRLRHDTQVLHVASSFQQWISTPLGVFAGVFETSLSEKPELSHHTVGGRLFGFDRLPEFLASGDFRYVVVEPNGLPDGLADQVVAASYTPIFSNDQGTVYQLGR